MVEVIAFVFGSVVGSFLNVCILRGHDNASILKPSRCPKCLHRLAWLNLIPIISYLVQRGKCSYCHSPISVQYPLVELAAGIGAAWLFHANGISWNALHLVGLFFFLIVIFVTDWQFQEVYDLHVILALLWTLGWQMIFRTSGPALAGAGLGLFFSIAIYTFALWQYGRPVFGFGDVTLSTLIGAIVGWSYFFSVYILALVLHIGLALARTLVLKHHGTSASFQDLIPFGPPLILASGLFPFVRSFL